ncbi:MAG: hypothetical protein AABW92_05630 [Nanoarchaeota archaeon]
MLIIDNSELFKQANFGYSIMQEAIALGKSVQNRNRKMDAGIKVLMTMAYKMASDTPPYIRRLIPGNESMLNAFERPFNELYSELEQQLLGLNLLNSQEIEEINNYASSVRKYS